MKDLFVKPDFDNASANISFTSPKDCDSVICRVFDGKQLVKETNLGKVAAGQLVSFKQDLPAFKPWSMENPFLYLLKIELKCGKDQDEYSQRFGMFKFHASKDQMYFNNKPFYMRGFIRGRPAHDHPNFTGLSDREYYEKNIKVAKAFGFNFIRFHSVVPPDDFLEAADSLGILCQVEIRPYYGKYQKERNLSNFDGDQILVAEQNWQEMIIKLRNHPCVMVYCMGNEINDPGRNDRVKMIYNLTKKLDPTRLFLDTTSRGEYDRSTADFDVQHMSYYAPFGKHYDMFNDSIYLALYGSITSKRMVQQDDEVNPKSKTCREIPVSRPLVAHEVGHYNLLRDPFKLKEKFDKSGIQPPWWVDELIKMIEAKGHKEQFAKMLQASTIFQYIWIKQGFESVRRSPLLQGFQFLQLSDTEKYENANGFVDCFDDVKDIPPEMVTPFNSPSVIVADLPKRTFMENTKIEIPIYLSHYPQESFGPANLKWTIKDKASNEVLFEGDLEKLDLDRQGFLKICRIQVNLPETEKPKWLILDCCVATEDGAQKVSNNWDIWLFPDKPQQLKDMKVKFNRHYWRPYLRYPQITADSNANLMISDRFDKAVLDHLEAGKDVLLTYRIDENRSKTAPREEFYLPSTWDRFKGIIWDRGHNCGGFTREHPIMAEFPQDGFINWQFYNLIEDSDKIDVDDFPVKVQPIIEGIDKAVRDRYDVGRFSLSEFQYGWTMRKFAYLFEVKVGRGRLLVTGMNFKGLETEVPEVCCMFESIIRYMTSPKFQPKQSVTVKELTEYLANKGKSKRIKERMMTQYWQLDDAPLESKQYWKESEEWLRVDLK